MKTVGKKAAAVIVTAVVAATAFLLSQQTILPDWKILTPPTAKPIASKLLMRRRKSAWQEYTNAKEHPDLAIKACWDLSTELFKLGTVNRQAANQTAESTSSGIFWSCLGFGDGSATGVTMVGATRKVVTISGGTVMVSRIAGSVTGAVVSLGYFLACKMFSG